MQNVIIDRRRLLPPVLAGLLPRAVLTALERTVPEEASVEELRLRRGRVASVTVNGQNLRLDVIPDAPAMEGLLQRLCGGSVYAHEETLREGYVMLEGGIRVGVCGRAVCVGGRVTGVTDISAFTFRIPVAAPAVGAELCLLLREMNFTKGVLLFAPPGGGKTTVLRGAAMLLAGGALPRRVVVADTRGELAFGMDGQHLLLDLLSGYPRGLGISIATRTLAAEVIVTDEVGDLEEAREIVNAHSCGVPLLASAHATELRELLARPGIRLLHESRCFGAYVGLARGDRPFTYHYDVRTWEDADALL